MGLVGIKIFFRKIRPHSQMCKNTHKYRLGVARFPLKMGFGDAPVRESPLFTHDYGPQMVKVPQIIANLHPYL